MSKLILRLLVMIKGTKPINATVPIFCSGSLKIWYVCSLVISCSLKSAINYNFNTPKSLVEKSRTNYFLPRSAPLLMMNYFGQLPSIILTQYDIFEFRDDWLYLLLYPLISIFSELITNTGSSKQQKKVFQRMSIDFFTPFC